MNYIDINLLDCEQIIGDVQHSSTDMVSRCQSTTSREIELRCLACKPSIGANDIPISDVTGFTTSPILVQFGVAYLTYTIARALRQSGSQNMQNDVYDGIMRDYAKEAERVAKYINYELVLNISKEAVNDNAFIQFVPLGG